MAYSSKFKHMSVGLYKWMLNFYDSREYLAQE